MRTVPAPFYVTSRKVSHVVDECACPWRTLCGRLLPSPKLKDEEAPTKPICKGCKAEAAKRVSWLRRLEEAIKEEQP